MMGADEPLRIHLTCYRALRASDDPRAPAVLARACRLLEAQGAQIEEEPLRRAFLQDVAAHRELAEEAAAAR